MIEKRNPNNLFVVSPSQIGMLLECPRCLWMYFREGLKRPSGPFPSLPGGFDGLFKKYFDGFRKEGTLPPELFGKIDGKLFDDTTLLSVWQNNWKGISAEFPEYRMLLRGAIDDLIVDQDGRFVPLDFKTRGYPTKEATAAHYQTQLDCYALLFSANGYSVADYGYLLFFWPKKYREHSAEFETELIKMSVDANRGKEILAKAAEIIRGKEPSAHSECEFCRFRSFGNVD